MSPLRFQDSKREEGFTLIELLVVVIIIGILAAIAIPVFLNQRERAWRSAVQSDLRNAAVAMETYYTDEGNYDTDDVDDLEGLGFVASDGVDVLVAGDDQTYCLTGTHENNPGEVWYLSESVNLTDDDDAC